MKRQLCALIFIGLTLLATNSQASTMRCGSNLISEGDSASKVLEKCGSPAERQVIDPAKLNNGVPKRGAVREEFWRYGPDRGVYRTLHFIEDKLVQIDTRRN